MTIKARKPTGRVPWPLVLLEGGEKAGKSWAAAQLSTSEKVGQTYWLDWGEGAADEYGAIPGARYLILEHDGTWRSVLDQVKAVKAEAQRAADADEPPVVLVIDSMTAEWDHLKTIADARARRQPSNAEKLRKNPDSDITISMNVWNDVGAKHRELMTLLLMFPGVVVVTARGGEVAKVGKDGKPVEGQKDYRVDGHKNLGFDATVWVRLSRTDTPLIVGARSVHAGIRPGKGEPKQVENFSLEWLIFDVLKCDPREAHVRDIAPDPDLDRDLEAAGLEYRDKALERDVTVDGLRAIYREVEAAGLLAVPIVHDKQQTTLDALIKARAEQLGAKKPRPVTDAA
jgi:hypothetical protein